jgi:hypothetical protein
VVRDIIHSSTSAIQVISSCSQYCSSQQRVNERATKQGKWARCWQFHMPPWNIPCTNTIGGRCGPVTLVLIMSVTAVNAQGSLPGKVVKGNQACCSFVTECLRKAGPCHELSSVAVLNAGAGCKELNEVWAGQRGTLRGGSNGHVGQTYVLKGIEGIVRKDRKSHSCIDAMGCMEDGIRRAGT